MGLYQSMLIGPPTWVYVLIAFVVIAIVIALIIVIVLKQKSGKSNLEKMEEYVFEDSK